MSIHELNELIASTIVTRPSADDEVLPVSISTTRPGSDESIVVLRQILACVMRIEGSISQIARSSRSAAFADAPVPAVTPMVTALTESARNVDEVAAIMRRTVVNQSDLASRFREALGAREFAPRSSSSSLAHPVGPAMSPTSPAHRLEVSSTTASSRGYSSRQQIWGVALASLMSTFVRVYIKFSERYDIVFNAKQMASFYTNSISSIYLEGTGRELPKIADASTEYLLRTMARSDRTLVPEATPENWSDTMKHPAGVEAMAILATIVMIMRDRVPEALLFPCSRLVKNIGLPFVVERNGKSLMNIKRDENNIVEETSGDRLYARLKVTVIHRYIHFVLTEGVRPEEAARRVQDEHGTRSIFNND